MSKKHKSFFLYEIITAIVVTGFLLFPGLAGGGDLEPSGPPVSTMKTLDEVEPRIPIDSLPYTTNASGSYYLTQNMNYYGSDTAIIVNDPFVKIDLMGYTITGSNAGCGIKAELGMIEITNGNILAFGTGISSGANTKVSNVFLYGIDNGINLLGGDNIVKNCKLNGSGDHGISVGGANIIKGNIVRGFTNGIVFLGGECLVDGNIVFASSIGMSACTNCIFGSNIISP